MAKNKWLVPSLVLGGLAFLGLSWYMSFHTDNQAPGLKSLGRVAYNSGEVYILHKNMADREELKKATALYHLDSLETGPNGDATVSLDPDYRLRVLDNTLLTVDQDGSKTIVILKRGDVQVEAFGRDNAVLISKNGQRYTPSEYEMNIRRESGHNFPELAPEAAATSGNSEREGSLSSEYIQNTLKHQIPAFDKCYKQVLQRNPGVTGQVMMNFTIERSGKIASSEVTTSSINDNEFKRCLSEALRRLEFKSFQGDPISSTFPINFE